MIVQSLSARRIKDSRNKDTIEVSVNGCKASSPSGESTGKYETPSYLNSLSWNIREINKLRIPFEINSFDDLHKVEEQIKIKFELDNAKRFGANALFALESALLKALAKDKKLELWQVINPEASRMPVPVGNAIGGGMHSNEKHSTIFQEFLLIPKEESLRENVRIMKEVHKKLKSVLGSKKVDDEGAWQTSFDEDILLSILSNYKEIKIGIDVAASSFF